jgi:hypothetical protein
MIPASIVSHEKRGKAAGTEKGGECFVLFSFSFALRAGKVGICLPNVPSNSKAMGAESSSRVCKVWHDCAIDDPSVSGGQCVKECVKECVKGT